MLREAIVDDLHRLLYAHLYPAHGGLALVRIFLDKINCLGQHRHPFLRQGGTLPDRRSHDPVPQNGTCEGRCLSGETILQDVDWEAWPEAARCAIIAHAKESRITLCPFVTAPELPTRKPGFILTARPPFGSVRGEFSIEMSGRHSDRKEYGWRSSAESVGCPHMSSTL